MQTIGEAGAWAGLIALCVVCAATILIARIGKASTFAEQHAHDHAAEREANARRHDNTKAAWDGDDR